MSRPAAPCALALLASALLGPAFAAGDPARGRELYAVCSMCHGERAQGLEEMNAPALAGREAWYLVRQLEAFRSGLRGSNPADVYGAQMAPMAKVLADKQAVEDVAAYLSSLAN